jgi:hypothetical protein
MCLRHDGSTARQRVATASGVSAMFCSSEVRATAQPFDLLDVVNVT